MRMKVLAHSAVGVVLLLSVGVEARAVESSPMQQRDDARATPRSVVEVRRTSVPVGHSADDDACCPSGVAAGQLLVSFAQEVSLEEAEQLAEEVGSGVIRTLLTGYIYLMCVPVGQERAFVSVFDALPEVSNAEPNYVLCIPELPPCECCPSGVTCWSIPPCVPGQDREDADSDGLGDICDPCTDTDEDGFGDPDFSANKCVIDNCPDTFNPDQFDSDGDGIGDLCEHHRVCICHIPPGRPDRAHTICVNVNALQAHLDHGDVDEPCENGDPAVFRPIWRRAEEPE